MSIHSLLFAYLTADPSVGALVGTRIYPVYAPQDAPAPLLVYSTAGREPGNGTPGFYSTRLTLDCFDVKAEDALSLAHTTVGALRAWVDRRSPALAILGCYDETLQDAWDEEMKLWRVSFDVIVLTAGNG